MKMFVSRKCLTALIHLFARKFSTCVHVAQLIHQRTILPSSPLPACNPFQPVAKKLMQRSVLALCFLSGELDVGLLGIKGNVLSHDNSVHDARVFAQGKLGLFCEVSTASWCHRKSYAYGRQNDNNEEEGLRGSYSQTGRRQYSQKGTPCLISALWKHSAWRIPTT